jgi:hypothetical protein
MIQTAALWNRKCVVTVGLPGGLGKKLEGLRTTFKIEKTLTSEPNTLELELYNLSPATIALIEMQEAVVTLEVGYEKLSEVLYIGGIHHREDTKSVTPHKHRNRPRPNGNTADSTTSAQPLSGTTTRDAGDIITRIECSSGLQEMQTATLEETFREGTPILQVLEKAAGKLGVTLGQIDATKFTGALENGLTVSGFVSDIMDELVGDAEADWSIQDDALQVLGKDLTLLDGMVILASEPFGGTGLIGSPSRTDKGCIGRSLLNPKIVPGRLLTIKSRNVNGTFKCVKVTYQGDTHGEDWYADFEAVTFPAL